MSADQHGHTAKRSITGPPSTCTRDRFHSGPCNGYPRQILGGVYCFTQDPEPAWVTALKTQLKAVTAERDQWREAAESCSGAVERLAVALRDERASHHD